MWLLNKTSNEEFHNPKTSTENQNRIKWLGKWVSSISNILTSTKNSLLNAFDNTKQAGKDILSEIKRWRGINPLKRGRSILNTTLIASQLLVTKPTMTALNASVKAMWNTLWTSTQVALGNEYKNKLLIEWSKPAYWYFDGKWAKS